MGNVNCVTAELFTAFESQLALANYRNQWTCSDIEYSGDPISLKSHRCKEAKSLCTTASNCISYCSKRVYEFCECLLSKGCSIICLKLGRQAHFRIKLLCAHSQWLQTEDIYANTVENQYQREEKTPITWSTHSSKSNILYLQILHYFLLHFVLHFL